MADFKFHDDGFGITAAEPWIKEKINVIRQYLSAFVYNLHGQVDELVFVDLFAGNGLYSLGAKREIFPAASLMSLSLDLPISRYVFCEQDPDQASALKIRINKYFRGKNVLQLDGGPDELLAKLRMYIPQSKDYKVAVFCLCDPFSLEIPFSLMDKLNGLEFSFLVPFTFVLNDQADFRFYLDDERDKVAKYLGSARDFERLSKELSTNAAFYKRLVQIYENNMLVLGLNGSTSVHRIDSGLMEVPFYYMGLFSRQFATKSIVKDVEAARNVQFDLFSTHRN